MGRLIELSGRRFGRWIVLKRAENSRFGYPQWLCRCICGTEKTILGGPLRSSRSESCGCLSTELLARRSRKPGGYAAATVAWSRIRGNARRRGITFRLTRDQVMALIVLPCVYCGRSETNYARARLDTLKYSGLDRVDSAEGYVPDNVVPCCKFCNSGKLELSTKDFILDIRRMYENTKDWELK